MHALGDVRADIRDHGALHRSNIRNDRAGLEMRRNHLGERTECADRRGQDHQIRTLHRFGCVVGQHVCEADLPGASQSFSAMGKTDDLSGDVPSAHRMRNRRANKPDAENGDAAEQGLGHLRPANSASAATTARLASSGPTVRRRQSGNP